MSNSFPTRSGAHVTGAVAMAVDEDGMAVPVAEDTPIGTVRIEDKFYRALAAHAAFVSGKAADSKTAEDVYRQIMDFAGRK